MAFHSSIIIFHFHISFHKVLLPIWNTTSEMCGEQYLFISFLTVSCVVFLFCGGGVLFLLLFCWFFFIIFYFGTSRSAMKTKPLKYSEMGMIFLSLFSVFITSPSLSEASDSGLLSPTFCHIYRKWPETNTDKIRAHRDWKVLHISLGKWYITSPCITMKVICAARRKNGFLN